MYIRLTIVGNTKLSSSISRLEEVYHELSKKFGAGSISNDDIVDRHRIDLGGNMNHNDIIGLILYLNKLFMKIVERTEVRLSIDGGQEFIQVHNAHMI